MTSRLAVLELAITLAACASPSNAIDAGDDATVSDTCAATAPAAGATCTVGGMSCGPFPYGHVDCFRPGQMTTGYAITATFTCARGVWEVRTMATGSCPDS